MKSAPAGNHHEHCPGGDSIRHGCQLIQIGGTRILTDPWFTQTATYYQGEPVASTVADLGRIDAVAVSHGRRG